MFILKFKKTNSLEGCVPNKSKTDMLWGRWSVSLKFVFFYFGKIEIFTKLKFSHLWISFTLNAQ